MKKRTGFGIIDLLVSMSILIYFSVLFISNFSSSRLYLNETVNAVVGDIRAAQTKTISSARFNRANGGSPDGIPDIVCGYGVHRINSTTYVIYTAPSPDSNNNYCSGLNRNYTVVGSPQSTRDEIFLTKNLFSDKLVFKNSFSDVFFEPPDPSTYINNSFSLNNNPATITVGKSSGSCSNSTCQSICVYPSGRIEIKAGDSC